MILFSVPRPSGGRGSGLCTNLERLGGGRRLRRGPAEYPAMSGEGQLLQLRLWCFFPPGKHAAAGGFRGLSPPHDSHLGLAPCLAPSQPCRRYARPGDLTPPHPLRPARRRATALSPSSTSPSRFPRRRQSPARSVCRSACRPSRRWRSSRGGTATSEGGVS